MSRTTRKDLNDQRAGHYYKESGDLDCYINHRDKKSGDKPPGWFKRLMQRRRRAKEKMAFRNGKEIPQFKKDNQWNWT